MTWNAGLYDRTSGTQNGGRELIDLAKVRTTDRILDLGCGTGRHGVELASRAREGAVLGIDASPSMIRQAEERTANAKNIELAIMPAEAMAFEEEFDLVFSNIALQWMKEQADVIRRVYRAIRPGGRIAFQLPARNFSGAFFSNIESAIKTLGLGERYAGWTSPWYFPTREEYAGLLLDAGFQDIDVMYRDYGLVFESVNEVLGWLTAGRISPYLEPLSEKEREHLKYAIAMNFENQRTERGIEFGIRRLIALARK